MGVEPIGDGIYPPPAGFEDRDDHRTAIASAASKCHGVPDLLSDQDQLKSEQRVPSHPWQILTLSLIYFGCAVVRR